MNNKIIKFIVKNKIKVLIFIIIVLLILLGTLISFAYFNRSDVLENYSAVVEYFENPDVNINVWVQNVDANGNPTLNEYTLSRAIPLKGYTINEATSVCSEGASYSLLDGKIVVSALKKSQCDIYYDVNEGGTLPIPSINILVYKKGIKEVDYSSASEFTYAALIKKGFEFTSANCTNGVTPNFDETNYTLNIDSNSSTTCSVYFDQNLQEN